MKKIIIASLAAMASLSMGATVTWELTKSNTVYYVDTLSHVTIGPGCTQTHLHMTGNQIVDLHYVTVDMTNPWVDLHVLKAGDDRVTRQYVNTIAQEHDVEGKLNYFAGINSDFFNMEAPYYYTNGNCMSCGALISPQNAPDWQHFVLKSNRKPTIAATMSYAQYINLPVEGCGDYYSYFNKDRSTDEMIIYSEERGATTGTNQWGSEAVVEPVESKFARVAGKKKWRVVSDATALNSSKGITIPAGKYVLSGNGKAAKFVTALKAGDEFYVTYTFKADNVDITPAQITGGMNRLLTNNQPIDVSSSNAPRSCVGYNADGTKIVFMAIDGRQDGHSVGAYYRLMAALLQKAGCTEGLELDGGGSTAYYCKPLGGIINKPSESRKVANGLYAVATCPTDNNTASIESWDKYVKVATGASYTPRVMAYNQYGVLIDSNVSSFKLTASPTIGTVSADGKTFKAASTNASGTLTVTAAGKTYTIPVTVGAGAGIDEVESDATDAPAVYYNLQGMKVNGEEGGVLIEVRDGHASKVIK